MRNWLLPEAIEDVLPAEAARLEALRRLLLDRFTERSYRLVQPPLVEHLESLLTGTGRDLELQTFKVVDPLSGRLLGVRADITREVVQIGAELYGEAGIDGDGEVIALLLSSLAAAGLTGLHLDLGHVGVYRALASASGIAGNGDDSELFAALREKDVPRVGEITARLPVVWRDAL